MTPGCVIAHLAPSERSLLQKEIVCFKLQGKHMIFPLRVNPLQQEDKIERVTSHETISVPLKHIYFTFNAPGSRYQNIVLQPV